MPDSLFIVAWVLIGAFAVYAEVRIARHRREKEEARIDVMKRAIERKGRS